MPTLFGRLHSRSPWLPRCRAQRLIAAGAATLLLVANSVVAATADTHASRGSARGPKPTIVFVHGAWADSSGWNAEILDLSRRGYRVVTIPNPLRGLTYDADYARARLEKIHGPIVLVGQSYGGAVITNAARGVPNVKALVYLASFSLDQGESLATVVPPDKYPGSHLDASKLNVVPVPNPAAAGGQDVDLYIKKSDFRDIFAADVSPQESLLEATTQRPLSNTAFTQPSGPPAWTTIPSWDLISLDDHAISPLGQSFMAHRMHARITAIHSAHDIMISHPKDVDRIRSCSHKRQRRTAARQAGWIATCLSTWRPTRTG
jgi:pimeloyl-ACP methyl ester carboxylesterase